MANQQVTIPNPLNPGDVLTVTVQSGVPIVTSVVVSGPAVVQEGATAQYAAQVLGSGSPSQAVTWSASDGQISPSGIFTAPAKVEQVTITATSQQDNTKKGQVVVSIANPGNTVTIAPSGGNDTAALQAALNKLTSGQVLQMLLGTWNLGPIFNPKNYSLLMTAGLLCTDIKGYGFGDCMFTTDDGAQISGAGAFVQMPNSFAASQNDGSEYRHAFRITGKGPSVSGVSVRQAGGDGFYGINLVGGSLHGVSAQGCFRNGCSLTDNVNGFSVSNAILGRQAGGDGVIQAALDVEPNSSGANLPCVVTISACQFLNNTGFPISNGLRLSLNNLNVNNGSVKLSVNNNVANGNTQNYHLVLPNTHIPPGWQLSGSGNSFVFP